MTELAIIGSDIQEVLGSATAIYILTNGVIPLWGGALITIFDSFLFLFIHYYGVRKLEFFFFILILTMTVCFMINMIEAKPDPREMLKGAFIPIIPGGALTDAAGMIGAIIMPHNLYLHSSLVLTRKVDTKVKQNVKEANIYNNIESGMSLFISFLINMAVISTFAAYAEGPGHSGENLDLLSASEALMSTFGPAAKYIWAIGILAAG